MNFNNMSVAARLASVFGVVLVITVVAAALSLSKLSAIQGNLRDIVEDHNVKIKLGNEMVDAIHVVSRVTRSVVLLQDAAEKNQEFAKITKAREDYDKAWEALQKFTPNETGKALRVRIDEAKNIARPLNSRVLALGMDNKQDEAIVVLFKEANPATQKWQDVLEENISYLQQQNEKQFEVAEADYYQARNLLLAACAISIVLAVVLGILVTRSITQPVARALVFSEQVAAGDLTAQLDSDRKDEIGALLASLKTMQQNLIRVVSSVRHGSEGVANASAEIAQGNQDLSGRTEQQASALEETAASMEELSSTVNANADSARQANQLARDASSVAVQGGEVVGQVVETMKGINDSSRKIADIIGVIDGIAFQTNILALNAAVEAARAGEQGRGFAVVASEVRSLAGRSADAAKEIKSLIGVSVERVERGSDLVDQAGTIMTDVVSAIKRVTDLMGEISAASNEQAAGVSQVGEAVVQMDQVTQQNAALVEEMAAAASSLKSQAQDLVQTVSIFKLDQNAPALQASAVVNAVKRKVALQSKPAVAPKAVIAAKPKTKAAAPALAMAEGDDKDWETF